MQNSTQSLLSNKLIEKEVRGIAYEENKCSPSSSSNPILSETNAQFTNLNENNLEGKKIINVKN